MITKTTMNMATKRGLAIAEYEYKNIGICYEFSAIDEDGEPADEYVASYRVTDDGLFFVDSCCGDTEEWPHWIESDKHLRLLLDAMAEEIKN